MQNLCQDGPLKDRSIHPVENIEVLEKTMKGDDNVKICRLLTYQESADISEIRVGLLHSTIRFFHLLLPMLDKGVTHRDIGIDCRFLEGLVISYLE